MINFPKKNIFLLFVSNKYSSVSYLLPYVVLNSGLFAVGQNISMNFLSSNNTNILLYIKISTSILGIIYALVFCGGLVRAFIGPTVFSLLSLIVPKKNYPNAATWSSSTWQMGW